MQGHCFLDFFLKLLKLIARAIFRLTLYFISSFSFYPELSDLVIGNTTVFHLSFIFFSCLFQVWEASYPARMKYERFRMEPFSWEYTEFSQFNESDTLLLVSGIYFGSQSNIAGEIAVFHLGGEAVALTVIFFYPHAKLHKSPSKGKENVGNSFQRILVQEGSPVGETSAKFFDPFLFL